MKYFNIIQEVISIKAIFVRFTLVQYNWFYYGIKKVQKSQLLLLSILIGVLR